MADRVRYLESRVGRRVLALYVLGAVLPIVLIAAASYNAMGNQLRRQSEERVRQISRNARQAIMQQLSLTESGVRLAAEVLQQGEQPLREAIPRAVGSIVTTMGDDRPVPVLGEPFPVPLLLASERDHLERGDMVLKIRPGTPRPMMAAVAIRPGVTRTGSQSLGAAARRDAAADLGGVVWALLEGDSIWGSAERFAAGGATRDFCLMAGSDPIFCRVPEAGTVEAFRAFSDGSASGAVRARSAEENVIIGHAELFLEAAFAAPSVRVLVSESISDLYGEDAALFRYSFGVALALGLLIMGLLAGVQIRRTMTPLEALTDGTERLAAGDLAARVPVTSPDEFGVLARSFNTMAERLDVQFQALEAGRAIDRAVLTAPDSEGVVHGLVDGFGGLIDCQSVAVLVMRRHSRFQASLFWGEGEALQSATVTLSPYDREWLLQDGGHHVAPSVAERPQFLLEAVEALGPSPLTVLPLVSQGELLGAVFFEAANDHPPTADVVARARQVADQAAVALDAVRLVGELEETNLGILRALARAIDAKSRWTAGHSERVTELSVELGRKVGLSDAELDLLQRGGLLHDVGKIGVPVHVLDSPGRPTAEEWALIREHPTIGVRILEPVRSLEPLLPIVLEHHERWDGKGYPSGLSGTEIHRLARILAVADTYDAMASARPYREALDAGTVLAVVVQERGSHFDPDLVDPFVEVMAARGVVPGRPPEVPHG